MLRCTMRSLILIAFSSAVLAAQTPEVTEIIKRSVVVNDADWRVLPQFTHTEIDVEMKGGQKITKTYEVSMMEGSEYNKLIALNGHPLSANEQQREQEKFESELSRRQHESTSERSRRGAKYKHDRET